MVTSVLGIFTTECVCFVCLLTVVILSKECLGEEQSKEKTDLVQEEDDVHLRENEIFRANKKSKNQNGGFMNRILPLLIVPFLISSALIPGMLIAIKFLLVKGVITGVIAVVIMLLNMFRARVNGGGVFNHYAPDLAKEHYGYEGFEEPGAYIPHEIRRKRSVNIDLRKFKNQ